MIRDARFLAQSEQKFSGTCRLTHRQALAFLDGPWAEVRALGSLPPKDPLAGIEVDIRVAAILDPCSKKSSRA